MIDLESVRRAAITVAPFIEATPVLHSRGFSRTFGGPIYLKAECLQRTGSFKVRGAANKLASLSADERAQGVIAASAGNHAQGVAVAAAALGVRCTIVMPEGAALAKVEATRGYGAEVLLHGADFASAEARAHALASERSRTFIPAFDDEAVVAGQGTLGLEVCEARPDLGLLLVPGGGGGLAGGVALAVKGLLPKVRVVGVQAAWAPAASRSYRAGRIVEVPPGPTVADGVALPAPGQVTLPLLREYLDDLVCVEEEAIVQAVALLLERSKLVVEGAGAVGLAALLSGVVKSRGATTVVVLSGGNIDVNVLAGIVEHGLLPAGRYLTLSVGLDDRPAHLAGLLAVIGASGANVLEVEHHRLGLHLPVRRVEVRLLLEVRNADHAAEVCRALEERGFVEDRSD